MNSQSDTQKADILTTELLQALYYCYIDDLQYVIIAHCTCLFKYIHCIQIHLIFKPNLNLILKSSLKPQIKIYIYKKKTLYKKTEHQSKYLYAVG